MSEIENKKNTPEDQPEKPLFIHTYQSDLAKSFDTTEASVVAKLIADAKKIEQKKLIEISNAKQKKWYLVGTLILILFGVGSIFYGFYYYKNLTVKTVQKYSVGIFPVTENIFINSTDIREVVRKITTEIIIPENKPTLVSLKKNQENLEELNKEDFFKFLESGTNEPFEKIITTAKLGIINDGNEVNPFLILSTNDAEISAKELLILEPKMLNSFYKVLNIDISKYVEEIGGKFESSYFYNIPIRTLYGNMNNMEHQQILIYGYPTENIIVITTKPSVLKSIYESIIKQSN